MISRLLQSCLVFCIRLYQIFFSPFVGNSCRFHPTCSAYAAQAITKYGLCKGFVLAFYRILRCNPWNKNQGNDPLR